MTHTENQNGKKKSSFHVIKGTNGEVSQIIGVSNNIDPSTYHIQMDIKKLNKDTGMMRSAHKVFKMKSSNILNLLDKSKDNIKSPKEKSIVMSKESKPKPMPKESKPVTKESKPKPMPKESPKKESKPVTKESSKKESKSASKESPKKKSKSSDK